MKKKEIFNTNFLPNRQEKLFLYDQYFKLFIKLYKNNLLPNKILFTGQSGLGKSTFAYHFINFVLSEKEHYSYDYDNFTINQLNRSFGLINKNQVAKIKKITLVHSPHKSPQVPQEISHFWDDFLFVATSAKRAWRKPRTNRLRQWTWIKR